jgi:hypothetical protein
LKTSSKLKWVFLVKKVKAGGSGTLNDGNTAGKLVF